MNASAFLREEFAFPGLCETDFSDKFGHAKCVILRDSCKLADLHFPPLTRSLVHVCDEIAQHHEISKMGSIPVARWFTYEELA